MAFYCLFDDERKFVFCVDPKCGCTTIQDWFVRIAGVPADKAVEVLTQSMRSPHDVQIASDYARVWFVRDPLQRLVSFYNQFVVRDQRNWCFADDDETRRLENSTFEDFIHIIGDLHDNGLRLQHHLESQTRTLVKTSVDRIVKIEDLESRSGELMRLLGVVVKPGHLNKRSEGNEVAVNAWWLRPDELAERPTLAYSSFWNDELRVIARRVYAKDCAFYASL